MTLQEYIKSLQDFAAKHPETLEHEVWYARDDEGNGYQQVYFEPSMKVLDTEEQYSDRVDYMYSSRDEAEDICNEQLIDVVIIN